MSIYIIYSTAAIHPGPEGTWLSAADCNTYYSMK